MDNLRQSPLLHFLIPIPTKSYAPGFNISAKEDTIGLPLKLGGIRDDAIQSYNAQRSKRIAGLQEARGRKRDEDPCDNGYKDDMA